MCENSSTRRDGNFIEERHDGSEVREQGQLFDAAPFAEVDSSTPEPDERERGFRSIRKAYGWAMANSGAGGAMSYLLDRLDTAKMAGRTESVRSVLDDVSMSGAFTDKRGKVTKAGHGISGALARIVLAARPDLSGTIELRSSKPLSSIDVREVLTEREVRAAVLEAMVWWYA